VADLQALPYPLHDFAGAFLAAPPSFDPAGHGGAEPPLYLRYWIPQFVLLVNLSKVSSLLCKLKPVLTFDKLLWREGCPKIALILSSPRASRASQPSLGCARALAELNLRPGLSMCQDRGEFRQAAGVGA
jgi:hypothetical protein